MYHNTCNFNYISPSSPTHEIIIFPNIFIICKFKCEMDLDNKIIEMLRQGTVSKVVPTDSLMYLIKALDYHTGTIDHTYNIKLNRYMPLQNQT